MLKRPIEGTKGPAQTALLMITLQQIEEEEEEDMRSWTYYRQRGCLGTWN